MFALFSGNKKSGIRIGSASGEWLWTNAAEKLYDAVFQHTDPLAVGKSFGLEYDKYMMDCYVIGRKPNIKKEIMNRVIGTTAIFAGMILTFAIALKTKSIDTITALPLLAGTIMYYMLAVSVVNGAQSLAKKRKRMITQELPRFTDLLHSALAIDMPIESAIEMIANALPGVLAEEMRYAMAEIKIGAKNWQNALEDTARKYEADVFSDFVLDLITASSKGVSILDAVARKSAEIKTTQILNAKEKTAKMGNSVLIPVALFKLLPVMLILVMPAIMQIFNGF